MSRTDIVDEEKATKAMELLREINKNAAIITTPIEKLEGKKLLEVMEHPVSLEEELLKEEHEHHHDHDHDEECGSDTTMNTSTIIMTMMKSVAADTTMNTGIIITIMMKSVAADTTMNTSIIITIMMRNAAAVVDMITIMTIITIMQMKYLQAGAARPLRNIPEKHWRKCSNRI